GARARLGRGGLRARAGPRSARRGAAAPDGEGARGVRPAGSPGVTEIARELVDDCIHCGFCLPTCPTYGPLWQEEMDSPRGRIYLMEGLIEETLPLSATTVEHFDRCLGCMACVTACPSGVRYDRLIEQTRAFVEERYERPRGDRALRQLVFALFPHPRRLRAA